MSAGDWWTGWFEVIATRRLCCGVRSQVRFVEAIGAENKLTAIAACHEAVHDTLGSGWDAIVIEISETDFRGLRQYGYGSALDLWKKRKGK